MTSSILDAAYMTAQEYPGGARALAMRMGCKSPAVLTHKLNPNDKANHLTVADLVNLMVMSGDHRALHAMNTEFGYIALPIPETQEEMPAEAIMQTCNDFATYLKSVTDALADGKVTTLELRKERKHLQALIAQAGKLDSILASKNLNRNPRSPYENKSGQLYAKS